MDMNLAPYIRAYLGMMKELGVAAVTPGGVQLNTTRDVVDNAPRRYGRVNRGIATISADVLGVPVWAYVFAPVRQHVTPPEQCYRIRLCKPDHEGRSI